MKSVAEAHALHVLAQSKTRIAGSGALRRIEAIPDSLGEDQ
jgi:hypothetical protein